MTVFHRMAGTSQGATDVLAGLAASNERSMAELQTGAMSTLAGVMAGKTLRKGYEDYITKARVPVAAPGAQGGGGLNFGALAKPVNDLATKFYNDRNSGSGAGITAGDAWRLGFDYQGPPLSGSNYQVPLPSSPWSAGSGTDWSAISKLAFGGKVSP